jgi:ribosome-associated heat shock protein Hsp15
MAVAGPGPEAAGARTRPFPRFRRPRRIAAWLSFPPGRFPPANFSSGKLPSGCLRLDRFLWFARLAKTRSAARILAEQGRIRIDGRLVDRAHAPVKAGAVLSFALGGRVRVLRILALPSRRGPAAEARTLYADLSPQGTLTSRGGGD